MQSETDGSHKEIHLKKKYLQLSIVIIIVIVILAVFIFILPILSSLNYRAEQYIPPSNVESLLRNLNPSGGSEFWKDHKIKQITFTMDQKEVNIGSAYTTESMDLKSCEREFDRRNSVSNRFCRINSVLTTIDSYKNKGYFSYSCQCWYVVAK